MSAPISQFADKMLEIIPVIHREFLKIHTSELYRGRLSIPQMVVLSIIDKRGKCCMSDLARFLDISTAAATGLIDRLVKAGYVNRSFDASDRRIINVGLTASGTGLARKIHEDKRKMIVRMFGRISESEREQYLGIIMHIHDVLQKERGAVA